MLRSAPPFFTISAAPPGRAFPLGWRAFCVSAGEAVALPLDTAGAADSALLRLTVAMEIDDERHIEIRLGERSLARLELRFACVFQPFHLALDLPAEALVLGAPLVLELHAPAGQKPVWFFAPADHQPAGFEPAFAPALLGAAGPSPDAPRQRLLRRVCSRASLQPFNWLEGCVLDGLADLAFNAAIPGARAALDVHLGAFFSPSGSLDYVGPLSEPRHNVIFGIEATLPFAALMRRHPHHPALSLARAFWASHADEEGAILDRGLDAEGRPFPHDVVSIEGCYTLAYPLALHARVTGETHWADLALRQIEFRRARLVSEEALLQRVRFPGDREQVNWARACCWYLLGLARTLPLLDDSPRAAALCAELHRFARYVLSRQRPDGLWSVYLDEPATGPDSSGSAGLAAGLAIAARAGLLADEAADAATRALAALDLHVTPDGFLAGCAQLNRGGDALQRSGYRVVGQFAMGLYAQAHAALHGQGGR